VVFPGRREYRRGILQPSYSKAVTPVTRIWVKRRGSGKIH